MENVIIRKTKAGDAEQYIKLRNLIWKSTFGHIFPEELFVKMENPENISKRIECAVFCTSFGGAVCAAEIFLTKAKNFFANALQNAFLSL